MTRDKLLKAKEVIAHNISIIMYPTDTLEALKTALEAIDKLLNIKELSVNNKIGSEREKINHLDKQNHCGIPGIHTCLEEYLKGKRK